VKRLILAGVLLLALAMAMTPITGAYSSTQRECVSLGTDTWLISDYPIRGATDFDKNESLGTWTMGDFDLNESYISFHATGAVDIDWIWNERAPPTMSLSAGEWLNETLWVAVSNGFELGNSWSHINITANNTDWEAWEYNCVTDNVLLNTLITVTEEDNDEDADVGGRWEVNDTINITAELPFSTFDAYLFIDYPSTAAGTLDHYPLANGTSIDTDYEFNVVFDKYGPAHELDEDQIENTVSGNQHEVTLAFESEDTLDNADWSIDPDDSMWDGAFDTLDEGTLVIEINGDELPATDWEIGSIDMKDIDIDDADNEVSFTWTTPGGGTGTTTPPPATAAPNVLTEEAVAGVPNWALGAIVIIICIAGYAIWKNEKKK